MIQRLVPMRGRRKKGGERAYKGRLGKDRSLGESVTHCEPEIGFTARSGVPKSLRPYASDASCRCKRVIRVVGSNQPRSQESVRLFPCPMGHVELLGSVRACRRLL